MMTRHENGKMTAMTAHFRVPLGVTSADFNTYE
jgi:hypothetical protein